MKFSFFKKTKLQDSILGSSDKVVRYDSKWPIYLLDIYQSTGLWLNTQIALKKLEKQKKLLVIEDQELKKHFKENPDIDFEILFFNNLMNKHYIFKLNNIIYSYTIGLKSKRKFYVRFYFDPKEVLLSNLSN
jgi:hypothetical protein